jgi:F0F1-type ATP synthase gamma subunit
MRLLGLITGMIQAYIFAVLAMVYIAMQAAEKSLSERKGELLGEFRRQRQDAITAEILDVVSGYEVLAKNNTC